MKRKTCPQETENIDPRKRGQGAPVDIVKMQRTGEGGQLSRLTRNTASTQRKFGAQVDPSVANQDAQTRPASAVSSRIPKPTPVPTRARFGYAAPPGGAEGGEAVAAPSKGVTIPVVPRINGRGRAAAPVALAPAAPLTSESEVVAFKDDDADDVEAPTGACSGILEAAKRCLTQRQSDAETLIRTKVKVSARADIKEKIGKRDEAIKVLREGMASLLQGVHDFSDACVAVEAGLRLQVNGEKEAATRATEQLEAQLKDAKANATSLESQFKEQRKDSDAALAKAKESEASLAEKVKELEAQLQATTAEVSQLTTERDTLRTQVSDKDAALSTTTLHAQEKEAAFEKQVYVLSEEVSRLKDDKAALETAIVDLSGRVREGESKQVAEANEKNRLEGESTRLQEEVRELRAKLSERVDEVNGVKLDAEKRAAELTAENIELQSRKREEETARIKAEEEVQRLTTKVDSLRDAGDMKSRELSEALKGFTEMQRSTQERENELRKSLRESEERAARAEARCSEIEAQLQEVKTDAATSSAEMSVLRESLSVAREQVTNMRQEHQKASSSLQEATASLAVERELRARAEQKEAEERQERIAANAQLLAMQQAHTAEMEGVRTHESEVVAQWKAKIKEAEEDREKLLRDLRDSQEAVVTMDRELSALKTHLADAEMKTKELSDLGKLAGEADVMKRRLIESEKERVREEEAFKAQVAELEAIIQSGEDKRRKMHNQIQELRGNVRVYARLRPFLPSDKTAAGALPCIEVSHHDDSMAIRKVLGDGNVLESHRFGFDKCFAPSTGQDAVFEEVSEFVQSALDGYNVCLFSYGQTGSGKTHTMQGFGQGPMRGIIPRAMEQVGKYKTQLEQQGWVYHMEVTFIEIYNESIRDLLRSMGEDPTSSANPDIRKDTKGNVSIVDATLVQLDPNDTQAIERIMEVAGRHRAVGSTDMNSQSSRSHSVFTLHLHAKNADLRAELRGKLNLCDLAGSERLKSSNATGDRLKETQAINKSLSSLTDVFVAIANKQAHVPFRNSKLTYLLQQCLTGDGKALMMVNLSPADDSYHESLCSLRFAAQVNKCELGRPRRNLQTTSASGAVTSATSSSVLVERASTLSHPTASSSSKAGTTTRALGGSKAASTKE